MAPPWMAVEGAVWAAVMASAEVEGAEVAKED